MKSSECILRKNAVILALSALAAFPLEACAREPKPAEESAVIAMTTAIPKVSFAVTGAKDIAIDWGDGEKSNVNDAIFDELGKRFMFTHEYSGATVHNIVISGNNITKLYCGYTGLTALDVSRSMALTDLICSGNSLTALDVSRNTALERLRCSHNQITALDVSKNTMLKLLECVGNQLTTAVLNGLFRALPDYSKMDYYADICISYRTGGGNPGYLDCDRSIAEKKRWEFWTER